MIIFQASSVASFGRILIIVRVLWSHIHDIQFFWLDTSDLTSSSLLLLCFFKDRTPHPPEGNEVNDPSGSLEAPYHQFCASTRSQQRKCWLALWMHRISRLLLVLDICHRTSILEQWQEGYCVIMGCLHLKLVKWKNCLFLTLYCSMLVRIPVSRHWMCFLFLLLVLGFTGG